MLADPRSENLVTNFASQWLHLRNLDTITPDMRLFPDFDDNLRQAFRQETELLVESVIRENRSVLDLLRANYTFVNERLAKHYGIPNVYGSRFRRIANLPATDDAARRGGLLRQGSILHGHFVHDAHVAGDSRQMDSRKHPRRAAAAAAGERAGARRCEEREAECAGARAPGRAPEKSDMRRLPQVDRPGRIRARELRCRRPLANAGGGEPIDASGTLFDGTEFRGVAGLQKAISGSPRALRRRR